MMNVNFIEDTHTYIREDGKELLSVTQLLKKHNLAPDYSAVKKDVLEAAANKGTTKHEYIERLIKSNGQDIELDEDVMWFYNNVYSKFSNWDAEVMIFTEGEETDYAGRLDLICEQNGRHVVMDIKTTSTIHTESVTWQLALYVYAYSKMFNLAYKDFDIYVIHIKEGKSSCKPLRLIAESEVKRLLSCEKKGEVYTTSLTLTDKQLEAYHKYYDTLKNLEQKKAKAEEKLEKFKKATEKMMEEYGLISFVCKDIRVSYVSAYEKKTFDKDKAIKKYPDLDSDEYYKTSFVDATYKYEQVKEKEAKK